MTDIERCELIINGKSEIHHPQLHGFQFLKLLPLHLRVFLCLLLILFLQFLLHKQNVRHKECKSLHLQQRTTPDISAVKNLRELCFLFSLIR